MGQPLRPPIGAFQRGDSFGYYLCFPIVSPLFASGVPGRVKSRLGSPPSWGSRGRTSDGVVRRDP
jgi:hypothetical protein